VSLTYTQFSISLSVNRVTVLVIMNPYDNECNFVSRCHVGKPQPKGSALGSSSSSKECPLYFVREAAGRDNYGLNSGNLN
jgi:hypothetical protein